ncbi:MAG: hypothetical protein H6856_07835 [Rhodospirillales bacterium]|nr:hypothetical protein [Rhodospirillales bacterium]
MPKSAYDYYNEHSKVFVGTVEEGPDEKGSYKVRVIEAFKGFDDKNEFNGTTDVVFDTNWCGFDKQEKGAKLLIFMNDGEKVSHTGGTTPIWQVEDQTKAETNLYRVILLRQMLDPDNKGIPKGAVPDEETAIYLAYKAMTPVFGKETVSTHAPYTASLIKEKEEGSDYEEQVWHIAGTSKCDTQKDSCENMSPQVKIHKWSGKVLKVYGAGG